MSQVAEKLSILKMTKEERELYSYYQKKLHNDRDELKFAEAKGEARGEARGKEIGEARGREEVAKNLLKAGIALDLISNATGLSIEKIEKLK
jgi:predicted transposase/invertase (TIGR01784 family)